MAVSGKDPMPRDIIGGGHFSELADFAARQVLWAWAGCHVVEGDAVDELTAAVKLLGEVVVLDVPEEYDPRPYIAASEWTYARTMPQHPHEYVVLRKSVDWREHLRFLRWIRVWGERELYKGTYYLYRVVDEWRYWAMGPNDTILNRRKEPTP